MDQIGPHGQATTIIHFVHQTSPDERIACMPNMVEFHSTQYHPAVARTNEPRAVTCPACKTTDAYRGAMEGLGISVRDWRAKSGT